MFTATFDNPRVTGPTDILLQGHTSSFDCVVAVTLPSGERLTGLGYNPHTACNDLRRQAREHDDAANLILNLDAEGDIWRRLVSTDSMHHRRLVDECWYETTFPDGRLVVGKDPKMPLHDPWARFVNRCEMLGILQRTTKHTNGK